MTHSAASGAVAPSGDAGAALSCDVLIVGGGINGTGIARDLAGRGWRVVLCEQDDLAAHTSSASTKLIHGGLRYLEHREFMLVRKALIEREVLLASAPHLMRPLRFVMPHDAAMRPAWLIRLGLFLYDHLAPRTWLPGSRGLDLSRHPAGRPLHTRFTRGFEYADGWVDDARLVVLCARDAAERGATIFTRTRCDHARRTPQGWQARLQPTDAAGAVVNVSARVLVNAAGPWAESFLRDRAQPVAGEALATRRLRLVKGSHIIVPRCFEGEHAYIFQNADGRIIFAIPYEDRFTLIGTTDVEVPGPAAAIDADEIRYLCDQASRYFSRPVHPADVVGHYSGVRPLLDDASGNPAAVTRDYVLEHHTHGGGALLTVWGGKITTFRKLAEQAADEIGQMLGERRPAWTLDAPLPGGDFAQALGLRASPTTARRPELHPDTLRAAYLARLMSRHPWLPEPLARRWVAAYGTRIEHVLAGAQRLSDLGKAVVPVLYEAELRHLQRSEWATTADDVLWRRTKLGLHLTPPEREAAAAALTAWFAGAREK